MWRGWQEQVEGRMRDEIVMLVMLLIDRVENGSGVAMRRVEGESGFHKYKMPA